MKKPRSLEGAIEKFSVSESARPLKSWPAGAPVGAPAAAFTQKESGFNCRGVICRQN